MVEEKAKSGMKKLLIVAPAFVTDCLETIVELEMEYGELFKKSGGEKLTLVRSLNDSDEWIGALEGIVR
jgi:ferrochelatase